MSFYDMDDIQFLCRQLSDARKKRVKVAQRVQEAQRRVLYANIDDLKDALAEESSCRDELQGAIEASPELFDKPKTRAFDGIKVGFQKQKGKIDVPDEEKTIKLIRQKLRQFADSLIVISEKVDKTQLRKLTVAELGRIGCTLTEDTDAVMIKTSETDVDKLVAALMKDYEDGEAGS
ncbi:MAG: hypothetical protein OXI10_06245 [Gammaproteobacteria bacterium]|nr:hypothetical protein [Gammaproteobacteria bacterium]